MFKYNKQGSPIDSTSQQTAQSNNWKQSNTSEADKENQGHNHPNLQDQATTTSHIDPRFQTYLMSLPSSVKTLRLPPTQIDSTTLVRHDYDSSTYGFFLSSKMKGKNGKPVKGGYASIKHVKRVFEITQGTTQEFKADDNPQIVEKVIKKMTGETFEQFQFRVMHEHMCTKLIHSNIPSVTFAKKENTDKAYLSLPYIAGDELHDFLDFCHRYRYKPSSNVLFAIMTDIFSEVAYCHSLGMVHADIAPDNLRFSKPVLVEDEEKMRFQYNKADKIYKFEYKKDDESANPLKLLDYGLAFLITEQPHRAGKLYYADPELLTTSNRTTYARDIYSAGLVACQVAGHFLIGENRFNWHHYIDKGEYFLNKNIYGTDVIPHLARKKLITLLEKMLKHEPSERLSSMSLALDLIGICSKLNDIHYLHSNNPEYKSLLKELEVRGTRIFDAALKNNSINRQGLATFSRMLQFVREQIEPDEKTTLNAVFQL